MFGVRALRVLGVLVVCCAAACGESDENSGTGAPGGSGGSGGSSGAGSGGASGSGTGGSGAAGSGGTAGSGTGGSAGSGGAGGTGGSGTSGTSGASGASSGDAGACDPCVAPRLEWRKDGGRVPYRDSSVLDCATYSHERDHLGNAAPDRCEVALTCAASRATTVGDVLARLADPDVTAAFGQAPVLIGMDTRPSDGQVLIVTRNAKAVTIGSGTIPAGIAALRDLLEGLDTQELAREPCASAIEP